MTSTRAPGRLRLSLVVYAAWALVTVFGMRWLNGGASLPLIETITHGIAWNLVVAIAVLAIATAALRWHDLKFVAPKPVRSLRVAWFPGLYLLLFALLPAALGLPPAGTLLFVFANTLLVGVSEEWMFRGVLFQALRSRFAMWPAILVSSALFGAVHVLNVILTGQLGEAVVQAVAAGMSGMVMMALLVRTGSLWVPIVYHALWDFGAILVASGSGTRRAAPGIDVTAGWNWTMPVMLVLPNFLYALFLLRAVRNDTRLATDG